MPGSVVIVVVTHDSERHLTACFGSLRKVLPADGDARVLAVDNGSRDATVARIRAEFPEVEIIECGKNLGFAGGNNVGIERALALGAGWVYLLNHDTEVTPNFLEAARRVAETDPAIAAVQSLLLLLPERHLIDTAGNRLHYLGFGSSGYHRFPREGVRLNSGDEIAYASGAGVLLRSEAVRRVGLFDERFFLYHEDLDLGWRLHMAGYRSVLAPESVVLHRHEFFRSPAKLFFMERNRAFTILKNASARTLLVLAPAYLASETALFVMALAGGWGRQKIRAWRELLRPSTWRYLRSERRRVQDLRMVPDRRIAALMTAVIEFEGVTGPFVRRVANPLMRGVWALLRPLV